MNMNEIREVAKGLGIKTSRMNKLNLVRAIQVTEGNFNCFASPLNGECDQLTCVWRDDCFATAKKLHS